MINLIVIFLAASRVANAGSKRAPRYSSMFLFLFLFLLLLLLHFVLVVFLLLPLLLVKTKPLGHGSWTHLSLFLHVRWGKQTKVSVVFVWAFVCRGKFMGFRWIDAEDFISTEPLTHIVHHCRLPHINPIII